MERQPFSAVSGTAAYDAEATVAAAAATTIMNTWQHNPLTTRQQAIMVQTVRNKVFVSPNHKCV